MKTAKAWKAFYGSERKALGDDGLDQMIDAALRLPSGVLEAGQAIVFPHTRLSASGHLIAAAAKAVVDSGCDTVLTIGVLHGGREADTADVARARAGDAAAIERLRRVHGPGAPGDNSCWTEEFSLDNFMAMVERLAQRHGRHAPQIVTRYPYLTGTSPETLPGMDELAKWIDAGAAVVATTDPVHHGVGYDTPPDALLPNDSAARDLALEWIDGQFRQLAARDWAGFGATCAATKSDFRDVGPVLAFLRPHRRHTIVDLQLVDYGDVLNTPCPTWVAAALAITAG